VEWFDFYISSFCALYFSSAFFPSDNPTAQRLNTAGIFAAGFLMRPVGGWLFGLIADQPCRAAFPPPCARRAPALQWQILPILPPPMIVLGVESSCDETGFALYDTERGLLSHALHSQVAMHEEYGGVVPELASRDHIRRALPLLEQTLADAGLPKSAIDAIAYTQGPGLAGALLVGSSVACSLALALDKPVLGVHHLEGHLLSPLLAQDRPEFPFIALLVSGGHTQLMRVDGVGRYTLLGETLDDAAGEAFDKSAKLLGLGYPGGPAISRMAEFGDPTAYTLPRPMLHSKDFNFSFSGLKTAVLTVVKNHEEKVIANICEQDKANIARGFVDAIVDVLTAKCVSALRHTGLKRLVIAGGVGANTQLRASLNAAAAKKKFRVYYPELEFCTDNGAMIAFAGALRLEKNPAAATRNYAFNVRPRWPLDELEAA
jgi:N6-L-threonylcarbamoyladenine synthase